MTPEDMARIHARAMTVPEPWSAQSIAELLASRGCFAVIEAAGFALGRVVLDEAELLTLAVEPMHQRGGVGTEILASFERDARENGANRAFLEVAANNAGAKALYAKAGWSESGLRRGYFRAKPKAIDAIVMSKALKSA